MKSIKDKKGHYVVEASIILPIFLIGIITLASVINAYILYENIVFSAVDESRLAMVNNYMVKEDLIYPKKLENRIKAENKNVHILITFQLAKGSVKQRYYTQDNIGMSKNIIDPASTCLMIRGVYYDEYSGEKRALDV